MATTEPGTALTLPFMEETYSVSELCAEIQGLLGQALPSVWVAGEVQRARASQRGHFYFELVEKGERDEIVGKLDAVLWRSDYRRTRALLARTGQEIAEGQHIRCRGGIDFYPAGGRLQLVVREVDPVFTLGLLAQRRRETLEALAAAGLLERNKGLGLPELPLKIALITSEGSAAYHDFLSTLRESGFGFRVLLLHAAVQGRTAAAEIRSALAFLGGLEIDCAVLIRGGGSRTDLAAFDGREVAEAVAAAQVPVLTGLGHEIDQSIADLVAHTALKTPTGAAEFLVDRVRRAEGALEEVRRALRREAPEPLRRAREAVGRAERGLALARFRLRSAAAAMEEVGRRLGRAGLGLLRGEGRRVEEGRRRLARAVPRRLERQRGAPAALGLRVAAASRIRLREARAALQGWARLWRQLDPERTLRRGFSITRDGQGALLRAPEAVRPGERITTRLAKGSLVSRVEER